jgi:cytochrome c
MIAVGTVAALVGLGFVHPFGDPRGQHAQGRETLLRDAEMPANAKAVLVAKCADCHSNETHWPVYSRVAPGSWLIERDIVEARKAMNLSQWETMPVEQRELLKAEIAQQAKGRHMPPVQYLALHWGAGQSPNDVQALTALSARAGGSEAALGGAGDAQRGKAVFEKRCTGCHAMEADREGPRLAEVYGRKAGSVAGFTYSAALKKAGMIWDDVTLEKFSVPKAAERRDLIAFLKQ